MARRAVDGDIRKVALNMKTTKSVRDRLEAAAARSGRSLTHEVEARIEQSFDGEEYLGGPIGDAIFKDIRKLLMILPVEDVVRYDDDLKEQSVVKFSIAREGFIASFKQIVEAYLSDPFDPKSIGVEPLSEDALDIVRKDFKDVTSAVIKASAIEDLAGLINERGVGSLRDGESHISYRRRAASNTGLGRIALHAAKKPTKRATD